MLLYIYVYKWNAEGCGNVFCSCPGWIVCWALQWLRGRAVVILFYLGGTLVCNRTFYFLFPQNAMNLPPDKARLLRQYDNEKKWELICDQVRNGRILWRKQAAACVCWACLGDSSALTRWPLAFLICRGKGTKSLLLCFHSLKHFTIWSSGKAGGMDHSEWDISSVCHP